MNIRLQRLRINAKRSNRVIHFSEKATFIHGPISKGKSTVARLIDFCFGGRLEETPAIQSEFVSAELTLKIGTLDCFFERSLNDKSTITVSWLGEDETPYSVNAPFQGTKEAIINGEVYNFSDLIFFLSGVEPIKVRKNNTDPDSDLIRLSIRDVLRFCYLDQTHLDSSFFRLEDPFRGRKTQDAMRFFTGLHSERLNQLENDLARERDSERGKRRAAREIQEFISKFGLGTDIELGGELRKLQGDIFSKKEERRELEQKRRVETHPVDKLRLELHSLSDRIDDISSAIRDSELSVRQQTALREQIITAKIKYSRDQAAREIFQSLSFKKCPECDTDVSDRTFPPENCQLCGSHVQQSSSERSNDIETTRKDFNNRVQELEQSIERRKLSLEKLHRELASVTSLKKTRDQKLQDQLDNYDSAYVETVRSLDSEIAQLEEKVYSLQKFADMNEAINNLEDEADKASTKIKSINKRLREERDRLNLADSYIKEIAGEFKRLLLSTEFPGVSEGDQVVIDPRNWKPRIMHEGQEWSFWDAGSGGKKTLFNVLYALALHTVALKEGLPVPNFLIIDSPTKNISDDENHDLVVSLYQRIYSLARKKDGLQVVLIDSDLVSPVPEILEFKEMRMAGEPDAPSLIEYYDGP